MKKEKDIFLVEPGDTLLVIGNIGLKGTEILAKEGKMELLTRYSESFVKSAETLFDKSVSETEILKFTHDIPHRVVEKGGIFRALWDISVEYKIGFTADIFEIPVKQETIELCNYFDINPYEMLSGKCVLAVVTGGRGLINTLAEKGIKACIIGEVMEGNDKVIRHQDGALFLRPSKTDSIDSFINKRGILL